MQRCRPCRADPTLCGGKIVTLHLNAGLLLGTEKGMQRWTCSKACMRLHVPDAQWRLTS